MDTILSLRAIGDAPITIKSIFTNLGARLSGDFLSFNVALVWAENAVNAQLQLKALSTQHSPVVLVVLQTCPSLDDLKALFQAGADVVDVMPSSPSELTLKTNQWFFQCLHLVRLKRTIVSLKDHLDRDHLTGLLNMAAFIERLEGELIRARQHQQKIAVVMIDLDNFKSVNDQNDHVFGSFVLTEVGRIIGESVGCFDISARFGGDEFVVGLVETDPKLALSYSERLTNLISSRIFSVDGYQTKVTASLGIAIYDPAAPESYTAQGLIRCADHALYRSKVAGKNRISTHLHQPGNLDKLASNDL